jgi:hypothetical protein
MYGHGREEEIFFYSGPCSIIKPRYDEETSDMAIHPGLAGWKRRTGMISAHMYVHAVHDIADLGYKRVGRQAW